MINYSFCIADYMYTYDNVIDADISNALDLSLYCECNEKNKIIHIGMDTDILYFLMSY